MRRLGRRSTETAMWRDRQDLPRGIVPDANARSSFRRTTKRAGWRARSAETIRRDRAVWTGIRDHRDRQRLQRRDAAVAASRSAELPQVRVTDIADRISAGEKPSGRVSGRRG